MTRTQQIRTAILGHLAHRPAGYGYPEATLAAEVRLFIAAPGGLEDAEIIAQIEMLEEAGYIRREVNPVLGASYYHLTDQGAKYAPHL